MKGHLGNTGWEPHQVIVGVNERHTSWSAQYLALNEGLEKMLSLITHALAAPSPFYSL